MAHAAPRNREEEALLLLLLHRRRQQCNNNRIWVHDINLRRNEFGEYHRLIQELRQDEDKFHAYFRMSSIQFDTLAEKVKPLINKLNTNYRRAISVEERLAICLRYLSTGDSFTTIAFSFRVGISTVGQIVEHTCESLWEVLVDEYLAVPDLGKWESIATRFGEIWNFPNCIGAMDGKHCIIQAPPNSGSLYFNYKGSFSIVLMALVDADYSFIIVDIGSYGSNSDGGIFNESKLGKALANEELHVPGPKILPGAPEIGPLPHVIVADPAFPLKDYLMRPYPGKHLSDDKLVFNYRLSRARRISENAFGLLTQRWRIYQRRINLHPEKAIKVIKATIVLHNFLQKSNEHDQQVQGNVANNVNADGVAPLINDVAAGGFEMIQARQLRGNRAKREAEEVRNKFQRYFCSRVGELPYQWHIIRRGQNT